jgi:Cu(I)/Ag(I) efflux system membrane protein CusA/SilA
MYWARSRVLEYLNFVSGRLPDGVNPTLGPDATGVGWVYAYTLESDRHDLAQLRSIQDWFLRYELTGVKGVAEVASVGGYVKQYQIMVDPNKLQAYNIPIQKIRMAIQAQQQRMSAAAWWKWARPNSWSGGWGISRASTTFIPCR